MGSLGSGGLDRLEDSLDLLVAGLNLTRVNGIAITLGQKTASASFPVVLASDQTFSATLAVALDKDNDSIAVWSNTAKDGSGTTYQPLLDSDGHLQIDVLTLPTTTVTATDLDIRNLVFATDKVDISGSSSVGVTGTFYQATQPVSLASVPSHAVTNVGTFAVQSAIADGADVTFGAKTDAKSTATDATSITAMQVLKQISASVQA